MRAAGAGHSPRCGGTGPGRHAGKQGAPRQAWSALPNAAWVGMLTSKHLPQHWWWPVCLAGVGAHFAGHAPNPFYSHPSPQGLVRPLYDVVMARLSAQVTWGCGFLQALGRNAGVFCSQQGSQQSWRLNVHPAYPTAQPLTIVPSPSPCYLPLRLHPSSGPGPGGEGVRHLMHGRRRGSAGRRAGC